MLDTLLDWVAVFLPTILSIAGVLVSVKAPHSKHHTALRAGLIALGVLISGVTFWQQSRSRSAHAAEVASLNGALTSVRGDLQTVHGQVQTLTANQQAEVGRREQAEKDLAIIVQGTGKATRRGVADDLRKSPLQVDLNGGPLQDPAEIAKRQEIVKQLTTYSTAMTALMHGCEVKEPRPELGTQADRVVNEAYNYLQNNKPSYAARFAAANGPTYTLSDVPQINNNVWNYLNLRNQVLTEILKELDH